MEVEECVARAGLRAEDEHIAGEHVHVHREGGDQVEHGAVVLQAPGGQRLTGAGDLAADAPAETAVGERDRGDAVASRHRQQQVAVLVLTRLTVAEQERDLGA